ncbi:cytochrome b/b6 domain-containing protein [Paucibacter sp. APW11]|uniref:Cytochrome b/b6 domain-containing protein n=1 Tax=Roseateles aquae TaxID=3077235 RepID=A0ABU3PFM5_9BURK|nr:cytochrome b/b6 domain-containing protein [Paucibacter sp. APW11]MDT9000721.1 cytochrome b/b6 domain-containing protein [Paucibacter sp. APW11]
MTQATTQTIKPDSPPEPAAGSQRVLVWDLPVRIGHWLMALSFAGAYLTAEQERWQWLHLSLGYGFLGLVLFRVLWGLFGSRHARFSQFVRGPSAVLRYLRSLLSGRPEHHTGHNPAGALAVLGLLGLGLLIGLSGHALRLGGSHALEELHEALAAAMLGLVLIHVAAVVLSSVLHRENLVTAMFSGRKRGAAGEAIRAPRAPWAVLMLSLLIGFWVLQWQTEGQAFGLAGDGERHEQRGEHGEHDDDD